MDLIKSNTGFLWTFAGIGTADHLNNPLWEKLLGERNWVGKADEKLICFMYLLSLIDVGVQHTHQTNCASSSGKQWKGNKLARYNALYNKKSYNLIIQTLHMCDVLGHNITEVTGKQLASILVNHSIPTVRAVARVLERLRSTAPVCSRNTPGPFSNCCRFQFAHLIRWPQTGQ